MKVQELLEEENNRLPTVEVGETYTLPYQGWAGGQSTKGNLAFVAGAPELYNNFAPAEVRVKVTKITRSKIYFDVLDNFPVSQYKFNPYGRNSRSGEKTGKTYTTSAKDVPWMYDGKIGHRS